MSLKKKHLERAIQLKGDMGYRKVHKRLKKEFDDYPFETHSALYDKMKPIERGEMTLGETIEKSQEAGEKGQKAKEKRDESDGSDTYGKMIILIVIVLVLSGLTMLLL